MRSTAIDRRTFLMLAAAAGAGGGGRVAAAAVETAAAEEVVFLAARRRGEGFEAVVLDTAGHDRLVIPLEARGHSFAIDRGGRRAVAFARGPGRFAIGFDIDGSGPVAAFPAAPDRHFFGHGCFADGDRLLIATENDYDGERGVAGVYDATDGFRRIGEMGTAGLDPHEAVMMPDGRTVCVANGGILTHPDYGKLELNLDTMSPCLAYVDVTSGETTETARLPTDMHQLAFHHLAVDAAGTVWFGCQYHGPSGDRPPVVGRHRRGSAPELFAGPADVLHGLAGYVGSVAVDGSGTIVATSSPVGGLIAYWDAASGRCLGSTSLADGCGVAPSAGGGFVVTSGHGEVVGAGPGAATVEIVAPGGPAIAWDNHIRRVRIGSR